MNKREFIKTIGVGYVSGVVVGNSKSALAGIDQWSKMDDNGDDGFLSTAVSSNAMIGEDCSPDQPIIGRKEIAKWFWNTFGQQLDDLAFIEMESPEKIVFSLEIANRYVITFHTKYRTNDDIGSIQSNIYEKYYDFLRHRVAEDFMTGHGATCLTLSNLNWVYFKSISSLCRNPEHIVPERRIV